ncbi:MAG: NUDIX domain-containing protein [Phycisphaerales bacterium]|nr:NUDIX domain-containing protein [Phycisphaerales bacterium]
MAERGQDTLVIGLIQRFDNAFLLCRPADAPQTDSWEFPRGRWEPGESAEAAMRRVGRALLGMELEIDVGMPPIPAIVGAEPVVLRYFFCGILGEQAGFQSPLVHRWAAPADLASASMAPMHRDVIAWLREQER